MATMQSVDWAIRKPLAIYDGNQVKESYDPRDITADIVLLERGCPYSLIAQLSNKKILMVSGQDTSEFRGGIKESDAKDAIAIWKLYGQKPELFKRIDQRNIDEHKLRYHIKMYYSIMRTKFKLNNESQALKREYLVPNAYQGWIDTLDNIKDKHEEKLIRLAKYLYLYEFNELVKMKGVGELNASVFVTIVDIKKFPTLSKLMMFCGYGHTYDKEHPKNYRYNRIIKNVVGTTARSIKMHKIEPYYGIYSQYKDKKLNEGKTKGHAENIAMRKICQILIKEYRKRLMKVARNRTWLDEYNINKTKAEDRTNILRIDNIDNINNLLKDKRQKSIDDTW